MRLFDLRPALYAKEEQEEKAIAIAAALPNRSPCIVHPRVPTLNGPQRELIPICAAFSVAAPLFLPRHATLFSPLSPLKKSNLCRTSKSTFALYFRSRRRHRRHVSQSATSYFRFASPPRSCLFQAPPFVNERSYAVLLLSVPHILLESRGRVKDMRFVTRLTHPST